MYKKKKRKRKAEDILLPASVLGVILFGSLVKNNMKIILAVLILVFALFVYIKITRKNRTKERYLTSGMQEVDHMTGEEFEYFLCTYFKELGYKAKTTPMVNDYGADVIAYKEGEKIVIQAKRYKKNVGIKAVQEVIGAKQYYKADKAMVITSSYFTPNAKNLAQSGNVELWDRTKLKSVMQQVQGRVIIDEMKKDPEYQKLDRTCPVCGAKLIIKKGKNGSFYGCENFPDCKFTKSM